MFFAALGAREGFEKMCFSIRYIDGDAVIQFVIHAH